MSSSSLSYLLLKSYLSSKDEVWYCLGSGGGVGVHWYCLIVDSNTTQDKNTIPEHAVVVDPWITNVGPVAVLYKHAMVSDDYPVAKVVKTSKGIGSALSTAALDLRLIQSAKAKYSEEMLKVLNSHVQKENT